MNILLIDAYHDSDRGGAGILAGVLNVLNSVGRELSEPIEIGIVYRFSKDDKRFESAARHTKKAFPDVRIYGAPIKTFRKNVGFLGKIESLSILMYSFLKICFPSLFSGEVVRAIKGSDFVISKGGHFYKSRQHNPVRGFISTYYNLYTLLLTMRLRKRFALIAHTIGPFNNYPSKIITRYVFKRANFLSTREEASKSVLLGMGFESSEVHVLPDTAFALIPAPQDNIAVFLEERGLKERRYAAVTARYWGFPDFSRTKASTLYRKYLSSLADIADYLIDERYVDKILLVVHNDGQHDRFEDDRKPISEILKEIHHKDAAIVIDEDLSPAMQSALYGRARIMIGTRLHSVIFALVGGAPAIAISYTHKTDGIMEMLGLERYVLDINSIEVSDAKVMIRNMITEEDRVVELVTQKIQEIRFLLKMALKAMLVPTQSSTSEVATKGG